MLKFNEHIEKLGDKYRLLSHTGKNFGTFDSHAAAAKHEGEVEYFKQHSEEAELDQKLDKDLKGEYKAIRDYSARGQQLKAAGRTGDADKIGEIEKDEHDHKRILTKMTEEQEMCAYCSHEPVDPKYAPYCSHQCSIRADQDNEMDEQRVLSTVKRMLREEEESANPKEEAKFTKVCTKHGFTLVKAERRIPNRFAPTHLLDELTFDKVMSNRTKPHRVKVTMYVDGSKSWKYWFTLGRKCVYELVDAFWPPIV